MSDDFDDQHLRARSEERSPAAIRIICIAVLLFWVGVVVVAFTGCATIREHPRLAASLVGVAVTSIALSSGHGDHQPADDIRLPIPTTRELYR